VKIIKPYILFENPEEVDEEKVLERLERYGRICYKSEHKIGPGSARRFAAGLIAKGHNSVLDHEKVTVRVVCDRGVTHEVVRHRIGAYSQESTRYCNYSGDRFGNEISVIGPFFFDRFGQYRSVHVPCGLRGCPEGGVSFDSASLEPLNEFDVWCLAMRFSEWAYATLINVFGCSPQQARSVLPNSLRTEIVITYDLTEWRHFLRLRTSRRAHPQMREIAIPLLRAFRHYLPTLFEDIPIPEDADEVSSADWEVRVGGSEGGG
jgi:thymidylate synthase (FAD)